MMIERLFSYGTLQTESVQLQTFGRKLTGYPDTLTGYQLSSVKIEDEAVIAISGMTFHPVISYTGDPSHAISGTVFMLTEAELRQADEYEVSDYKRTRVELKSGEAAWVFISSSSGA